MHKNKFSYLLILFLISSIIWAQESATTENKANKILKKVDENLMPESFESYRKLVNEEPDGSKKEFIFFSVKKGKDKVAMLYISPASEKGRATLRLGDNMCYIFPMWASRFVLPVCSLLSAAFLTILILCGSTILLNTMP